MTTVENRYAPPVRVTDGARELGGHFLGIVEAIDGTYAKIRTGRGTVIERLVRSLRVDSRLFGGVRHYRPKGD